MRFVQVLILTIASAISAEASDVQRRIDQATPGSTIIVEPGVYEGPLVIDKPLKLVGRQFPRIEGGGAGNVISIRANDVTVQGLLIVNSGFNLSKDNAGIHVTSDRVTLTGNRIEDVLHGVYLKKTDGCRVLNNRIRGKTTLPPVKAPGSEAIEVDGSEYCAPLDVHSRGNGIHLWNSKNGELNNNTITDTRDGMYFSFTHDTAVRGNLVRKVRYGLHYMYSDNNEFEGNIFSDNAAGAAIMYSKNLTVRGNHFISNRGFRAYGMLMNSVDATTIEGNFLSANTVGIYLENNNNNTLTANHIDRNYIGVRMTASSNDNVFSQNVFVGNMHPAELAGQNESNHWALEGVGNHWQSATAIDLDGDGVGNLPHREVDLLGGMRRDLPFVSLLSGSPGLRLLQFAHQHVAVPGMEAIEDPAPLTPQFRP